MTLGILITSSIYGIHSYNPWKRRVLCRCHSQQTPNPVSGVRLLMEAATKLRPHIFLASSCFVTACFIVIQYPQQANNYNTEDVRGIWNGCSYYVSLNHFTIEICPLWHCCQQMWPRWQKTTCIDGWSSAQTNLPSCPVPSTPHAEPLDNLRPHQNSQTWHNCEETHQEWW